MLLYDFAGQPEFYSSHLAVMENVMQRSAAIFINVVDVSKSKGDITREVHYWLNFMENAAGLLSFEVVLDSIYSVIGMSLCYTQVMTHPVGVLLHPSHDSAS